MAIKTDRTLISTAEAAELLGVTQGRIRQLVLPGSHGEAPVFWSDHVGSKILVVDRAEVVAYGRKMQRLRDRGQVRGQAPGGFKKRQTICLQTNGLEIQGFCGICFKGLLLSSGIVSIGSLA